MKVILKILFFVIVLSILLGYYIKNYNDNLIGEKIIGFSVAFSIIVFIPLFLSYRLKNKFLKDYTLTSENYNTPKNVAKKKIIQNK
tara:strand:- start:29761 stop:30018 length:258 start_codon:yes stop_codon:yes gene_type:complete